MFSLEKVEESIRNSADGTLLSAPDSLVASVTKNNASDDDSGAINSVTTPRKVRNQSFGIDAFDNLNFTYKVSGHLTLSLIHKLLRNTIRLYVQILSIIKLEGGCGSILPHRCSPTRGKRKMAIEET